MEKYRRDQFSFSTYEAYKKIKKNDPLKMVFESVDWSFIYPILEKSYDNRKELIYHPVSLFKAQLLIYLGEAESNRDLAEKLRFNTKYCVLCGFHHFLKTPAHSTFSAFRKKVGHDLFHKLMHRIVAQSIPVMAKRLSNFSSRALHVDIYSKEGEWMKCNCKGKCKIDREILVDQKNVSKKNFVSSGLKIKLFIDKKSGRPIAAEIRLKSC